MKISIRKSKHQNKKLTTDQINFANKCVIKYLKANNDSYWSYEGTVYGDKVACDVYRTKTTISAIVWYI